MRKEIWESARYLYTKELNTIRIITPSVASGIDNRGTDPLVLYAPAMVPSYSFAFSISTSPKFTGSNLNSYHSESFPIAISYSGWWKPIPEVEIENAKEFPHSGNNPNFHDT